MKSEFCILLFALVGHIQASIIYEDELIAEFELFKVVHEKSYEDDSEEQLRLQIFKDNKELIDRHNERYSAGEESYYMGVNQFADMTSWEFQQLVLTPLNTSTHVEYMYMPSDVELPSSVDWRARGAVTSVKNQGQCGSCWSFAAAGALESQWYLKTKQLIPLSEQNLIDCSSRYNNHGCNGGWPALALLYVKDNGGIDVESAYPYEGHDGHCRFNRNKIGARVSVVMQVRPDEEALAHAVAEKGPIAVAVDARRFQHYRGGIFNDRNCNKQVNHAVIVVGYGSDYWLIKNSWGAWGEQGYMRLARNHNNMCHVATYGVFPTV